MQFFFGSVMVFFSGTLISQRFSGIRKYIAGKTATAAMALRGARSRSSSLTPGKGPSTGQAGQLTERLQSHGRTPSAKPSSTLSRFPYNPHRIPLQGVLTLAHVGKDMTVIMVVATK